MYASQTIPIEGIKIPERIRAADPAKVEEFKTSLGIHGLIHPIVTDKDFLLADGLHRLEAAKALGWTQIDVRLKEFMPELERCEIELVANLRRTDFTWQESALGVWKLHQAYMTANPDWGYNETADRLGFTKMWDWKLCEVARSIEGDSRIAKAETISSAYNIVTRKRERALDQELSAIGELEEGLEESGLELSTSEKITIEEVAPDPPSIFVASFLDFARYYAGPKFNLIHCDFPYGVGMDKSDQGRVQQWEGYKDDAATYWKLCKGFIEHLDNFCLPSAHIIFWFSMNYFEETKRLFSEAGLRVDPFPLIWHKTDNIGILPDSARGPRRIYETAFQMARGDRKIIQSTSNLYGAPGKKIHHQSEKSEAVLRYFFKMYIDENSEVLDPTCGAGSALRAAEHYKAKRVLGLDLSKENVEIATELLSTARRMRRLSGD